MDEALEAVELLSDAGLDGAVAWLFRIVGALLVIGGLGLWLFTETGLLWVPAVLLAVGGVLVLAPSVLFALAELT